MRESPTTVDDAPSGLAMLVEAEARLDRAVADARVAAAASIEDAHRRARDAADALERELAEARTRSLRDHAARLAAERSELAAAARAEVARCDAQRGEAITGLARRLTLRLVALATEEAGP